MSSFIKNLLATFIVLTTIISVNESSSFPIGNTYSNWVIYTITTILFIHGKKIYYQPINNWDVLFIQLYLTWVTICIVRGLFIAEYYWDFKNLIGSSLALLLVVSVYVFSNPQIVHQVLSTWIKYAIPIFFVLLFFVLPEGYGYFLVPISFFSLFFSILPIKWKMIVLSFSILVVFSDLDARSNVIKFIVPLLFSILFFFKGFVRSKIFKVLFKVMFVLPLFFLILGVSNVFNVFQMDKYINGTYKETKLIDGVIREVSLTADTRTFLYNEVITSAISNDYVLFGRTLARGNDSEAFGTHAAEELKTGRYERHANEVSILNVFTWTGLVGVILYFLVFYKAVSLAIVKSNSHFLKIIGLYLAFRWMYTWVEDFTNFNISNIILWIIISMCYSVPFRKMTDRDFKNWLLCILKQKTYKFKYTPLYDSHNHSRT